jgi:hypothetical protein
MPARLVSPWVWRPAPGGVVVAVMLAGPALLLRAGAGLAVHASGAVMG